MKRTAAGSALVCAGFVIGAVGATLASHQAPHTAVLLFQARAAAPATAAPHLRVGHSHRVASRKPMVSSVAAATSGTVVAPAGLPAPAASPAVDAAALGNPAGGYECIPGGRAGIDVATGTADNFCSGTAGPRAGIDVSLDPLRTVAAATDGILSGLTSVVHRQ